MNAYTRVIAVAAVFGVAMTGLVLARGAGAPAPQAPAPAGQPTPTAPGRGAGAGPAGAPQGGAPERPRRPGGFTQFTRPLASQDVLLRGQALYDTNCASCHAVDLRGRVEGNPNLLRSGIALRDQKVELVTAAVAAHTPALTLPEADTVAIAEYIHSIHATMDRQGSPPGRYPRNIELNLLVGDAAAGEATFGALCASCHSVTGDLRGIGGKFPDVRALQNGWVSGTGGGFGGAFGGRGNAASSLPATVTMADGSTLEGTLVRQDDFLVILTLADGTRKSMARTDGVPSVEVRDPKAGHKQMLMQLVFDDPDNEKLHDITAYL